jgi:hypothetical protein
MKTCAQCGTAANDGAVKCRACKAWLIASAPPGVPAPPAPTVSSPPPDTSFQPDHAGSVALATGAGFDPRGATTSAAPTAYSSVSAYPGELLPRGGRVAPAPDMKTPWDRRRAMPFIAAGCAVVVAAAGLWFVLGRGHSTAARPPTVGAHTKAPTATPHPTAKQRAQAITAAQTDLRNALTAEKVAYVDQQAYVASPSAMRAIEPSIAWGTRMHLGVGDALSRGDRGIVCLSETTRYGNTFTLADVALGPAAGTYLGTKPCPARLTAQTVVGVGRRLGP